jgi:hypothetical protein
LLIIPTQQISAKMMSGPTAQRGPSVTLTITASKKQTVAPISHMVNFCSAVIATHKPSFATRISLVSGAGDWTTRRISGSVPCQR